MDPVHPFNTEQHNQLFQSLFWIELKRNVGVKGLTKLYLPSDCVCNFYQRCSVTFLQFVGFNFRFFKRISEIVFIKLMYTLRVAVLSHCLWKVLQLWKAISLCLFTLLF